MEFEILDSIVMNREIVRPVAWIARHFDIPERDVRDVLRVAGDPDWARPEIDLDKYDRMEYLVSMGTPQSEIMRTLKCDSRTVKKWFPEHGFTRGGTEHQALIKMGAQMRELEGGYA